MATHASSLKRARQSERKRERNTAAKSELKTYAKKVIRAVEEKNPQAAKEALRQAMPAIQKASAKKVIHKKTAARRIARLAKKVNTIASSSPAPQGTPS